MRFSFCLKQLNLVYKQDKNQFLLQILSHVVNIWADFSHGPPGSETSRMTMKNHTVSDE